MNTSRKLNPSKTAVLLSHTFSSYPPHSTFIPSFSHLMAHVLPPIFVVRPCSDRFERRQKKFRNKVKWVIVLLYCFQIFHICSLILHLASMRLFANLGNQSDPLWTLVVIGTSISGLLAFILLVLKFSMFSDILMFKVRQAMINFDLKLISRFQCVFCLLSSATLVISMFATLSADHYVNGTVPLLLFPSVSFFLNVFGYLGEFICRYDDHKTL